MRRVLALVAGLGGCNAPEAASEPPSPTECVQCHALDFERTLEPPHVGVRPTTCGVCHTQDAWSPDVLNHAWTLDGAHTEAGCFDCHSGTPTVFEGTPDRCVGCHADDERETFEAHHGFGTDCAGCHTTTAWRPAEHPPEPEPPPILDAGAPDAGPVPPIEPTTRRRRRGRADAGAGSSAPEPSPTPDPPPDTTTRASRHW